MDSTASSIPQSPTDFLDYEQFIITPDVTPHVAVNGNGASPHAGEQSDDPTAEWPQTDYAESAPGAARDADLHAESDTAGAPGAQEDAGTPKAYWRSHRFTLREFLKRPKKLWLVDKVLGVRDFILLYAESGHAKTFVALDLAMTLACGRLRFADTFDTTGVPLTVAYCTGEGVGGLSDRLEAACAHYGTDDVPFLLYSDIPQLFAPGWISSATNFIDEWLSAASEGLVPAQLDVLILDTMANATAGADENSAKDAGVVQAMLRKMRDVLGCTIILVHHAGKSGVSERGSSALRASMDTVLRTQKIGHSYTLACEKLKDGEAWPALSFDLASENDCTSVRVNWTGAAKSGAGVKDKHTQTVLQWLRDNDGEHTAKDVGAALGEDSTAVYRWLAQLVTAGEAERNDKVYPKTFSIRSE